MIKTCKVNQENVFRQITNGVFDKVAISESNLADDIIISMYDQGILSCISDSLKDKRKANSFVPYELIFALAIASKMKVRTSITDIPFAITDHRALARLGYNIVDSNGSLKKGIMEEGCVRALLRKYNSEEFFSAYNNTVQNFIMPKINANPTIHILDCTDLEVNFNNYNYEGSEIAKNKNGDNARGYKLGTIRGIYKDTGIIEEICFGSLKTHDFTLTKDMVMNSKVFKRGDCLINDRGFLDRGIINYLKSEKGVDTYVPLKINMEAYNMAVNIAQVNNEWENHPSRDNQKITLVTDLGVYWDGKEPQKNVDINAAVVWDTTSDNYFVFATTDTSKNAKQIVKTYELRPEIEEDYRQLKDFWLLEDFKSTKLNMIAFHIVTILFGYLFFQIYTTLPDGEEYSHKCLPVILKNYYVKTFPYLIFYVGDEFGILSIIEFAKLYASCEHRVQKKLEDIFGLVQEKRKH